MKILNKEELCSFRCRIFLGREYKRLYESEIAFLIRQPAGRMVHRKLKEGELGRLERYLNAVRYEKGALFIRGKVMELYGKEVYGYMF